MGRLKRYMAQILVHLYIDMSIRTKVANARLIEPVPGVGHGL
jgi:hypothetical protein